MRRARRVVSALAVAAVGGCAPPPSPEPVDGPRLVLLIVVDQLKADYLERFDPLLTGGLRRLLDEGAVLPDAVHRHAVSHTGPGHAALVTGVHPRRHGIVANYWVDPILQRRVYCVEDERHTASPAKLLVSTLGDWIKRASPEARVYGLSGKDRSAILLAGHAADGAYWYDGGDFVSSGYYPEASPAWLGEFNARHLLADRFGTAWEPLPVDAGALAAAGVVDIDLGPLEEDFPHVFGGLDVAPTDAFYRDLFDSPWLDEHTTRAAEALIEATGVGADGWVDLVAVGYSALDAVGHEYGAESPEVADVLLRLDRELGALLDFVDRRIGLEHVVVALGSDHGVAPLPELHAAPIRRRGAADVLCLQRVNAALGERFGEADWLWPSGLLSPLALRLHGAAREEVEAEAARLLTACPAVERVWTRGQVEDGSAAADPDGAFFANGYHPGRSPDLMLQFEHGFMPVGSLAATHGSHQPYDTRVPIVVRGPGVAAGRILDPVDTVDLAPTLAALVGVEPEGELDGRDLGSRLATASGAGD